MRPGDAPTDGYHGGGIAAVYCRRRRRGDNPCVVGGRRGGLLPPSAFSTGRDKASRMADGVGGSEDGDKSVWGSEGEVARSLDGAASPIATSSKKLKDAPVPSLLHGNGKANGAGPSASLVEDFVEMGLIKENGDGGAESLLELLLTYKAIGNNSSASVWGPWTIGNDKGILVNWDAHDASTSSDRGLISDDSGDEDFLQDLSQKDEKIESLVRMGFPKDEAEMAIVRYGGNDEDLHEEGVLKLLFCLHHHLEEITCKVPMNTQKSPASLTERAAKEQMESRLFNIVIA